MHNLKQLFLILIFLGVSSNSFADTRFSCNSWQYQKADPFVETIIEQILVIRGIPQKYHVCKAPASLNAYATISERKRIIAYDAVFLAKLSRLANRQYWGKVAVLAHEIGHHLLRHTDKLRRINKLPEAQQLERRRQWELEADKFAGRVLGTMGASLSDSQAVYRLIQMHSSNESDQYSDHPQISKRLKAVKKGWIIGKQKAETKCNNLTMPNIDCNIVPLIGRQSTPGYVQVQKEAQRLRGKIVTKNYCKRYANLAVEQTKRSIQHNCGFNIARTPNEPSAWSPYKTPQEEWCNKHSSKATFKETKFRETRLDVCYKRRRR